MNLEQNMEKQLLRARPMARLFPHRFAHFHKRCLKSQAFILNGAQMDGWMDSHGYSEKQNYAIVHDLTVDGVITLETNPPCRPLTSQSD